MRNVLLFLGLGFASSPLFAAGIVGNGTPSSCTIASLQNKLAGGGLVSFQCGANPFTFTLPATLIIKTATTLDGANLISFSGGKAVRLVENSSNLTLKNITLRDGYSIGTDGGAAVWNHYRANLTVFHSKFLNNTAQISPASGDHGGGAIALHGGTLKVDSSQFLNNKTLNGGGGVIHSVLGNMQINTSLFRNNQATRPGYSGAIYSDGTLEGGINGYSILRKNRFINNLGEGQGGAVFLFLYPTQIGSKGLIENCEFIGNKVTADQKGDSLGGALRLGNGAFTVNKSSFINNTAQAQGGGIWTGEMSSLTLTNSTFSGNQAELGGALMPIGSGNSTLTHNTIVYNIAAGHGGAIYGGGSNITLSNNIIAHNQANNPWNINHNCGQWLNSGGGNIQFPARFAPWDSNDHDCVQNGVTMLDPQMGTLGYYNKAYTQTYSLKINSPAIDAAADNKCLATDQRNVIRPQGLHCDVGAFEVQK
jgi:hypothetical protein